MRMSGDTGNAAGVISADSGGQFEMCTGVDSHVHRFQTSVL